jgi:hypothetical protein
MVLAHLRWNLETLAAGVIYELLSQGISVAADVLLDTVLLRVGRTGPRSAMVPWYVADAVVEPVAAMVARLVVEEMR